MIDNILEDKEVLVAEDNLINQMVVKHTLTKMGANVEVVNDGAEAIEKLNNREYNLVLMDIQMPILDGYETTQFIRSQLKSTVPIIAMTAYALFEEEERCYKVGMNGYVSKPFTLDGLFNEIQKVLSMPAKDVSDDPHVLTVDALRVDLSILYEVSGNDPVFVETMIQTFLENFPVTIIEIEEHFKKKDWQSLYKSAHFAKSSLSIIKVEELFSRILKIEQNAKYQTNLDDIEILIKQVKEGFEKVKQSLADNFRTANN